MPKPWWRVEAKSAKIPQLAIAGRNSDRLFQIRLLRRWGLDVQVARHPLVGYSKHYIKIPEKFSTVKAAGLAHHVRTHRALRRMSHVTKALRHFANKPRFPVRYAFKNLPKMK